MPCPQGWSEEIDPGNPKHPSKWPLMLACLPSELGPGGSHPAALKQEYPGERIQVPQLPAPREVLLWPGGPP
ncbi:hypothetical protein OROHE_001110 [Orobanche hederae]